MVPRRLVVATARGSRLQRATPGAGRQGGGAQQSGRPPMKTGDAEPEADTTPVGASALGVPTACQTKGGRSTRRRAARATSVSYTPSAMRSTHSAYAAAATAAAQRCVAALGLAWRGFLPASQGVRAAALCFVLAAGISAGRFDAYVSR